MSDHKVVRIFDGKEYYLDDVATSKRLADSSARSYRDRGYLSRVVKLTNKRFGVWLRKEKKEGRR